MQIGGLGYANNVASATGAKTSGKTGGNFNSLILAFQNHSTQKPQGGQMTAKDSKPSLKDLKELLSFLKNNQLLDLKDGLGLQDKLLSNPNADILQMVKNYFGLSDGKWSDIVHSLLSTLEKGKDEGLAVSLKGKGEALAVDGTKSKDVKKENGEDLAGIVDILSIISSLPPEKMSEIAGNDFPLFLKAVKVYEILNANQDVLTTQQTAPLSNLLAKVQQTLETIITNQAPTARPMERMDFLQNTFTRLAGELNTKDTKKIVQDSFLDKKLLNNSGSSEQVNTQQSFQLPMSKAEQLTLMLHSEGKPVSADDLIKQFEAILAKSQLTKTDGMQKLLIKLNPENLGSLSIELTQKDEGIIARIMTTTGSAKETLDSQLNGLKQAFAAQNIQVDRIEVAQQFNQQERFQGRDQQPNQQQPQQQHDEKEENNNQDSGEFTFSLNEALLNMEV
ncbi:MAG: flagellar hook-length control protein FliK [Bacillota bacterium]|nr:flagellar hook-length control protein FliK [Bacillota bacterium]